MRSFCISLMSLLLLLQGCQFLSAEGEFTDDTTLKKQLEECHSLANIMPDTLQENLKRIMLALYKKVPHNSGSTIPIKVIFNSKSEFDGPKDYWIGDIEKRLNSYADDISSCVSGHFTFLDRNSIDKFVSAEGDVDTERKPYDEADVLVTRKLSISFVNSEVGRVTLYANGIGAYSDLVSGSLGSFDVEIPTDVIVFEETVQVNLVDDISLCKIKVSIDEVQCSHHTATLGKGKVELQKIRARGKQWDGWYRYGTSSGDLYLKAYRILD